jgi:hypothetical protein
VIDPTKYVPIETHQALIGKVALHDEERQTASVDAAIAAGKIAPANRDWALDYIKKDEAGFTAFATSAPVILKAGEEDTSLAAVDRHSHRRGAEHLLEPRDLRGILPQDQEGTRIMVAATADRNTPERLGEVFVDPVAAATKIFAGTIVCLNAAGNAVNRARSRSA